MFWYTKSEFSISAFPVTISLNPLPTPCSPAIASSAKLAAYCEKLKVSRRLVINRSGYSKFEMSKEDTEKMFGDVAFVSIPEDKIVPESLSKQKPVYLIDRGSPFAAAIDQIARVYGLKAGDTDNSTVKSKRRGFFEKIAWWGAKDGSMDFCACSIYDGKKHNLGLSCALI